MKSVTPREGELANRIIAALHGETVHDGGWARWVERAELTILGVETWIKAFAVAAEADTKGEVTT
jgi:hypothetical protein